MISNHLHHRKCLKRNRVIKLFTVFSFSSGTIVAANKREVKHCQKKNLNAQTSTNRLTLKKM